MRITIILLIIFVSTLIASKASFDVGYSKGIQASLKNIQCASPLDFPVQPFFYGNDTQNLYISINGILMSASDDIIIRCNFKTNK